MVFAYPPLPWIGARFKFDVREKDGSKVLAKTTDNRFFQRATVFIGTPEMSHYTIQADVMSDGNKRKMSEVGVINQHYLIVLKGNEQKLEVNSNQERLRASEDFKWSPNVWYRLKARVERNPDGSAVVQAKAWKRGEPEPAAWTIAVPHKTAHQAGSPGPVRLLAAGYGGVYRQRGGHAGCRLKELNQLHELQSYSARALQARLAKRLDAHELRRFGRSDSEACSLDATANASRRSLASLLPCALR